MQNSLNSSITSNLDATVILNYLKKLHKTRVFGKTPSPGDFASVFDMRCDFKGSVMYTHGL
jgi:hypothetical protein